MIHVERKDLTVSVYRGGFQLRSFMCRCLQAAVTLETKLNADAPFASWWATANDDPKPGVAHPYERPVSNTPTPVVQRTNARRTLTVTTECTVLIISDGKQTRRKRCSTDTVACNLATRYGNNPELADRWLYGDKRDPEPPTSDLTTNTLAAPS